jgi:hypothetical protein
MAFTAHDALACVELAVYILLLVPLIINTTRYLAKRQTGWLLLVGFALGMFDLTHYVGWNIVVQRD